MNATTFAPQLDREELPVPSRLTFTVILPYLALAVTFAAYQLRVPARLAALTRAANPSSAATGGDYPVPTPRS